jgi:hypothetical protein
MIPERSPEELWLMHQMLEIEFSERTHAIADKELGEEILEFILIRERIRHGVESLSEYWANVDKQTLLKMQSWDTVEYKLLLSDRVFKLLVKGRNSDAVFVLKDAVQSKAESYSQHQREIAKNSRPKALHPLTIEITKILNTKPNISMRGLYYELKREVSNMEFPTLKITDSEIIPTSGKHHNVPRNNLRQYLSRAKKKIHSNG